MGKYVVGVMAFILVVAGGYYLWKGHTTALSPQSPVGTGVQTGPQASAATTTYSTSSYSVVYSTAFSIDTAYSNTSVNPDKPIAGVKFTIPMEMATGTNLSADSYVSIEQLPHAKNCTGDIYLSANVKPVTMTDNGVTYSVATSTDAAAGNRYEEAVFAYPGSSPCTAVRYFIHSTAIENYPAGTVREYDRSALLAAFDTIRRSVQLNASAVPPATTPASSTSQ